MASSIPTQLSPGVRVSEVDISQFVQTPSLNSAGMAGVFNWGPVNVATSVSSESELASMFGKPTLDASDATSEDDFLSAANFLKYSTNLKVVRIGSSANANAATTDAGITGINSCTYRNITNEDQFRLLGGFSGNDGIEPNAHFRARYPGVFGNGLKVVVFDGPSGENTTASPYVDYVLAGGYAESTSGISNGTIGFTFSAEYLTGIDASGNAIYGNTVASSSIGYYTVTLMTPGIGATAFIDQLSTANGIQIYYASGSTGSNYALANATNPSGNAVNYHVLEDATLGNGTKYNPFSKYNNDSNPRLSPKGVFAKPSAIADAVDIIFIDGDQNNMKYSYRVGSTGGDNGAVITRLHSFQYSGVPANFGSLIFDPVLFELYRTNWSNIRRDVFGTGTGGGWALLVGLTADQSFTKTVDGIATTTSGITFDLVGGLAGVRKDFAYNLKQFGKPLTNSSVEARENFTSTKIFEKNPATSQFAASVGGFNDELSVAVIDTEGKFGPKNSILERFELLSKATDAKNLDGDSIYYKDYINTNSRFVYCTKAFGFTGGNANTSSTSTALFGDIISQNVVNGITYSATGYYDSIMRYGSLNAEPTLSDKTTAYNIFADDDSAVDILYLQESSVANDTSAQAATVERMIYDNVIEPRKDTVFVVPTPKPGNINQHTAQAASNAINFRKNLANIPTNSYTVMVAGRKLFYDTYNQQTRRMSLSSDLAGIMSAQEIPWESPAGAVRGNLRNAIRVETNFTKRDRDELYRNQVNFFTQFSDGTGTYLFGDKTLLTKPSAFDRINVRRVFIAIEKALAQAARFSLFEFNDEFTRSQFRNLVNPFLANILAQRGISDFRVVCDETNNTTQVIDSNQFVADIYIKPQKSINFVQLNFIAVRGDFNLTVIE